LDDRRRQVPALLLADGHDVMRVLGLRPGPRVGRILERLRERQLAGTIRSREEALRHLERMAAASRRA
jgi:hypothetical protein